MAENVINRLVERHGSRLDFNHNPAKAVTLVLIVCNQCNLLKGTRKKKIESLIEMKIVSGDVKGLSAGVSKYLYAHCLSEDRFDEKEMNQRSFRVQDDALQSSRAKKKNEPGRANRIKRRAENEHSSICNLLKSMVQTAEELKNDDVPQS